MANLSFPQLSSGALVQYPLRKTFHIRTITNTLSDGTVIAASDPQSARARWELVYQDLSTADRDLLSDLFALCSGPWLPFVFIDPVGNMLNDSSNLVSASWQIGAGLAVQPGAVDPFGSNDAFLVTNSGQAAEEISQTLTVPAGYQYCFSIYALAATPAQLEIRRSADTQQAESLPIGATWTRLVSSGQLNSALTTFTIAISLAPGQQATLFGPQLEPQSAPTRYRPTVGNGGVYPKAHWGSNNLTISAASPSLFNISCAIETSL